MTICEYKINEIGPVVRLDDIVVNGIGCWRIMKGVLPVECDPKICPIILCGEQRNETN